MEGLWRGWRFAVIGMKKLQDIFRCGIYATPYHPMVMRVFCLPLQFFGWSDTIKYNLILNIFHKICILISSPEA